MAVRQTPRSSSPLRATGEVFTLVRYLVRTLVAYAFLTIILPTAPYREASNYVGLICIAVFETCVTTATCLLNSYLT